MRSRSIHILVAILPTILFISIAPTIANASGFDIVEITDVQASATMTEGAELMGMDGLHDLGYDGTGVEIAILDTGINTNHPDINVGTVTEKHSFVPAEDEDDYDGHGTFISGIIIGDGTSSSGINVGVAIGSEIWNVKVLDQNGEGEDAWVEDALDWLLSLSEKPDILSLSFGTLTILSDVESKLKQLWDAGVVVVVSAGNEGPEYYTLNSPGNVLDVITVGACSLDGYLMSFSSEGPTLYTDYYKPDLVALGTEIVSLDLYSGYAEGHGTSFSVPFIAGGISLLVEATGGAYSPDEIKSAVLSSCQSLGYDHYMEGAGLPNFTRALEILQDSSWNGFFSMPDQIDFPVEGRQGTSTNLASKSMKITVINSKYDGRVDVEITGSIEGKITFAKEEFEETTGQFALSLEILPRIELTSSNGEIIFKEEDGTILGIVTLSYVPSTSLWLPILIVIGIVAAIVGIIGFTAIAYRKGVKSLPDYQCEMDGTCPVIPS